MRKFNEENERIKHKYLYHLRHAKGRDEPTLDKIAAGLLDFEEAHRLQVFQDVPSRLGRDLQAALRAAAQCSHRRAAWLVHA